MNAKITLGILTLTAALAACGGGPTQTAPANPATFTAAATSSRSAELRWSAVTGAAGFVLERKTAGGSYATVANHLPASNTHWADSNLNPATTYTYRLKAYNAAGSSGGVEANVTTPAPGDTRFNLSVAPEALTVQSGRTGSVQVTVSAPEDGQVTLSLEGDVVGSGENRVQGQFVSNPVPGGQTALQLTVGSAVPVGTHLLTVRGRNGDAERTATLRLTVERWLLVDDDRSGNNWGADPTQPSKAFDSAADSRARSALEAADKAFDVVAVGYSGSGQAQDEPDGPSTEQLRRYSGVLWYTGSTFASPLTQGDLDHLQEFLDAGERRLILVSPGLLHNAVGGRSESWQNMPNPVTPAFAFAQQIVGVDQIYFQFGSGGDYSVSGVPGTVTEGASGNVTASVRAFMRPLHPAAALLTAPLGEENAAVAIGRAAAGGRNSSKVVLAGVTLGSVAPNAAHTLLDRLMKF
ncbi:hypothetical protein HNR42_003052 [Deinobacterium chartae]|uniref:Fibronectin type-III domain-containing protein n=1 Tax=Deinobacterium chartae TaxID=521158 RepID=A0A841I5Q3_9DEIO|nr:fibronectin type III domain-containing protein [Deinobacterium chartae]MBB6099599.1 hypothetical protein [Deinobacterium chartae]